MTFARPDLADAACELAVASGAVANYCDHVEHNEGADVAVVREAAETLRALAFRLSERAGEDAVELYADRVGEIERRNVLCCEDSLDGAALVRRAEDLRALQLAQIAHDRAYHTDVVGLRKLDQLNHYALHLAKLAAATAAVAKGQADEEDWLRRRVPDMLLFGLKLSTVTGEKLSETALDWSSEIAEFPRAA